MKPHLPLALLKSLRKTAHVTLTLAAATMLHPQAAAEYDSTSYTLSIGSRQNAAIRMDEETSHTTFNGTNSARCKKKKKSLSPGRLFLTFFHTSPALFCKKNAKKSLTKELV